MEEEKKETKKVEQTKEPTKKSQQGINIAIVIVVILVLIIMAYLIFMVDSPKKAVETMLGELKSGTYDEGKISDLLNENFNEETAKLLFEKLQWKILKTTEEGDKATVEVEITNKDFKTIIGNYTQKVIKIAFGGTQPSDEEMTNYLIEELNNDEIQNVTSTQSILVEKQDGKWKISEENNIIDILLPGFNEVINSFNN